MATTQKTPPVRVTLPKNKTELSEMLGELGKEMRELADIDKNIAERIAEIKEKYALRREELKKVMAKRVEKISNFTHTHRSDLLEDDSKTVTLETGVLSFYFGPTAVTCEDDELVIEECKRMKLLDAIRIETTLDREWIEKHKDDVDVPGVSFVQTEFLKIVPVGHDEKDAKRTTVREVEVE